MGFFFISLGIPFIIIGLGVFLPARRARHKDRIRQSWPVVKGTITSSRVVEQPPLVKGGKEIRQFDPAVRYQFRHGGQLHFGSSVSDERFLLGEEEANRVAARYPEGAAVDVHINPENIQECYLELTKASKHYTLGILVIAVGGILALIGFVMGFLFSM